MKARLTPLLLGAQVVFILCMGAFCEDVANETCGQGFDDTRGAMSVGTFGTTEEAVQLEAFLEAVAVFDEEVIALTDETEQLCRDLGTDLGVDMTQAAPGDVEAACQLAAAQLDEDITFIRDADLQIIVEAEPARCNVELDVVADCYARCDASFDAEVTPPTCTGGAVYVGCDVGCRGECRLPEISAVCEGQCQGSCDAGFEGRCEGSCTGMCSGICEGGECSGGYDEEGNCIDCTGLCRGDCSGTCTGEAWGYCEGTCTGGCVVDVEGGGCEGECWGECEAEVDPIRCEGGNIEVEASAECEASCEAEASFNATCTEPRVFVTVEGDVEGVETRVELLAAALEDNLPAFLELVEQLGDVVVAGGELVSTAEGGLNAAVAIGARAVACVGLAASVSVEISVEVDVTLSAAGEVTAAAEVE